MVKFIITDIEGTISPLSFTSDLLTKCARVNMEDFVYSNTNNHDVLQALYDAQEYIHEVSGKKPTRKEVVQHLIEWLDRGIQHPALLKLELMLWKLGYENGDIKGQIYADVPLALDRWREKGIFTGTYSSNTIEWQKLLLKNSSEGDLLPYFSAFFDTGVGEKTDIFSYFHVADKLNLAPNEILFLSDNEEELEAARKSGMGVLQIVRKDAAATAKQTPHRSKYLIMNSFDGIDGAFN